MASLPNSSSSASVLVVDDEPDLRTLYELTLVREGYDVESAGSVDEAWLRLQEQGPGHYQLVITDMRLPDGNGIDLLRRLEAAGRPEKTIVITAYGSAENAVEALKSGAFDYLTKPVDLKQLRAAVTAALQSQRYPSAMRPPLGDAVLRSAPPPPAGVQALARIVGTSGCMVQIRNRIEKVATSMAPVLILGESGTGKELVARAVHECSHRAGGPFVAVNCGAIPENLVEAEFFGVRKGKDHAQDVAKLNPVHVIVAGVLAGVLFVVGLVVLVWAGTVRNLPATAQHFPTVGNALAKRWKPCANSGPMKWAVIQANL